MHDQDIRDALARQRPDGVHLDDRDLDRVFRRAARPAVTATSLLTVALVLAVGAGAVVTVQGRSSNVEIGPGAPSNSVAAGGEEGAVDGRETGQTVAWAAPLVEAAEGSPRLLLEGWAVERADIYGGDQGEMTFVREGRRVDVHWLDGASFDDWVADRANSAATKRTRQVLGHEATMFLYRGGQNDWTTLFHDGRHAIEVRGRLEDPPAYAAMLDRLVEVDVDTWLAAMPDSVIASADRPATVRAMLSDVPVPAGFDAASLEDGPLRDRYQLGATVAGAVACAWLDRWVDATERGDEHAAEAAVAALQTTHDWDVLEEMVDSGGYPANVWEYADAVAGDGTVMGGRLLTVEESYREALGCDLPDRSG